MVGGDQVSKLGWSHVGIRFGFDLYPAPVLINFPICFLLSITRSSVRRRLWFVLSAYLAIGMLGWDCAFGSVLSPEGLASRAAQCSESFLRRHSNHMGRIQMLAPRPCPSSVFWALPIQVLCFGSPQREVVSIRMCPWKPGVFLVRLDIFFGSCPEPCQFSGFLEGEMQVESGDRRVICPLLLEIFGVLPFELLFGFVRTSTAIVSQAFLLDPEATPC